MSRQTIKSWGMIQMNFLEHSWGEYETLNKEKAESGLSEDRVNKNWMEISWLMS